MKTQPPRSVDRLNRFVGIGLDISLWVLTAGLGWLVWTLVLASRRQTPAKLLRRHSVIDPVTKRPLSSLKFFARTAISFVEISYIVAGIIFGYGVIIDVGGYWFNSFIFPGVILSLIATDFFLLLTPAKRRLLDLVLTSQVVHKSGEIVAANWTEAEK